MALLIKMNIMKLELKHLAPYLSYGVKVRTYDYNIVVMNGLYDFEDLYNNDIGDIPVDSIALCLRPLSDLTKEIEVNGEKFVPVDWFEIGDDFNDSIEYGSGNIKLIGLLKDMAKCNFIDLKYLNYGVVEKLLEWHFDVFGLIEQGLAIDINTLNK